MTITIETDILFHNGITPNQFTLLYLLYHNKDSFKEFVEILTLEVVCKELEVLEKSKFIHNLNKTNEVETSKIVLRGNFLKLISTDAVTDYFEEFIHLYPVKVQRPDGFHDYLRTDLQRCRKKYNQIVGGKITKHKRLMDLLKYEIEVRERENSMKFMKRLPKWLASEEWEVFDERKKSDKITDVKQNGYGTSLL